MVWPSYLQTLQMPLHIGLISSTEQSLKHKINSTQLFAKTFSSIEGTHEKGCIYSGTPRLPIHEMRTPLQTGQLFPPQIPLFRVFKLYSAPLLSRLERFHHIKVTPKHILCTHTYNTHSMKKDSNTKKCVHINYMYISTEN